MRNASNAFAVFWSVLRIDAVVVKHCRNTVYVM